jgi:hypothetical protein
MADHTPKDSLKEGGKGKARVDSGELAGGAKASQPEQSLAVRVVSSASGLLRDTVGSSNGHVPGVIASSTTLGSKAQSSGSSSGSTGWAESIRPGGTTNGSTTGQQEWVNNESFRTPQPQSSATDEFEQFVSSPPGAFHASAQLDYRPSEFVEHRFEPGNGNSLNDSGRLYSAAPRIGIDDGAEVKNLLSDPAFDSAFRDDADDLSIDELSGVNQMKSPATDLDDGAEVRHLLLDTTSSSAFDDSLNDLTIDESSETATNAPVYSQLEREIVAAMRSDLPPPPVHKSVPTDHPLNLRPLSDAEKESLPQQIREYEEALAIRGQSLDILPSEDEREVWLSDWEDVLSGYSDHVWGDMLPTVRTARSELEDVRNGSASLDSKTIARLKMILGHVHAHAGPPTPDSMFARQRINN